MSSRGEHVSRRGDIIENSLKSTPRLEMYFHDISSSLEIFRSQRDHEESFSEHISRRGDIIDNPLKSIPRLDVFP